MYNLLFNQFVLQSHNDSVLWGNGATRETVNNIQIKKVFIYHLSIMFMSEYVLILKKKNLSEV